MVDCTDGGALTAACRAGSLGVLIKGVRMLDDEGQTEEVQEHSGDLEDQVQVTQLLELLFDAPVDQQDHAEAGELVGDGPQGRAQQPRVVAGVAAIQEPEADHAGDGGEASPDVPFVSEDPRAYPRRCFHVDAALGLVVKDDNLIQVKDEELDGAEEGEDPHQKTEHLVIHFILVLPDYLLQNKQTQKQKIMETHEKMAEPAPDRFPRPLGRNGGAQSNNGMWTGHGLDGHGVWSLLR